MQEKSHARCAMHTAYKEFHPPLKTLIRRFHEALRQPTQGRFYNRRSVAISIS